MRYNFATLVTAVTALSLVQFAHAGSAADKVTQHFAVNKEACTFIGTFPITVSPGSLSPSVTAIMNEDVPAQMLALEKAGVVKRSKVAKVTKAGAAQSKVDLISFDLTELGAKYFGPRESDIVTMSGLKHVSRPELCFATQKLIGIKKTDEGKTADGRKKAVVTYQLSITPNDWAKGKDISDAFPEIRRSLQKSGKDLSRTLLNDDGKWIFAL